MNDRFHVRVYQLSTKRCLQEAHDYAEGEAASVMTHVRRTNGPGFVAVITPEKSVA